MTYTSLIGGARGIQYFILGALLSEYNQVPLTGARCCPLPCWRTT